MKTQINKQHTNVDAVQSLTKSHKEDRLTKRSFTITRLAVFALLAVLAAMPAMAATCDSNSCTGYVSRVYVTDNSVIYVSLDNHTYPHLTCNPVSGWYFTLDPGIPNFDRMYNLLLQAEVTGTPVILRANPSQGSGCHLWYVVAGD
jgi:hypothetical protein